MLSYLLRSKLIIQEIMMVLLKEADLEKAEEGKTKQADLIQRRHRKKRTKR